MKIAIAVATIGLVATGVNAAPYYVGETLRPQNNITLNFQDTMTKEAGTREAGNIAAVELRGAYNATENIPVTMGLPFYFGNKDAFSGESRNALGNISAGFGWTDLIPTSDREMTWGYDLRLNGYAPTSRKAEGSTVATANPSIDYYRFATKAMTIQPQVGLFVDSHMLSAKINGGYGYVRSFDNAVTSKNRNTVTGQVGTSWHAMPNLDVNLEYNAIMADGKTFGDDKYRHAIAPSISGNYNAFLGSVFASIPLDSVTREVHNVAFGLNAGYTF